MSPNPESWAINGVPAGFGAELMTPDYDILEPFIEGTIERVPAFGDAGIKTVVNGPIAHTPDALPLVGPAPGLRNYWAGRRHGCGHLLWRRCGPVSGGMDHRGRAND